MKTLVTSYTFDASEKTVTTDVFTSLEKIQLITNVTDQIIIYNFADTAKGGSLTSTTLTLEYDTTSMSDSDKLQIFVEDGATLQPVSGTVAATQSGAWNVTNVSGTVSLPTGAATAAKQLADNHQVTVSNIANTPLITGFATEAKQLPDGHAVTVDNESIAVTGTFWQTTQPVSGTVTANAGTNLNTSTLALEAGGNLATIAGKDFATQTTLAAINSKMVSGTDIGDVTINNGSGASAVNIQDGGNTITIDYATTGSGTATGALRVELPTNGTGVIATVGAVTSITNALPSGTNAIGKLTANSGVDIGDVTLTAGTAAVGSIIPPDTDVTAHTNYARKYYTYSGAVTDGIVWSPAAGKRWHVVTMYIQTSADATITLEDDKSGGDDPVWKGEIAAKSGVVLQFTEHYPMASGEDAADLIITTSAGNVYCTVVGYEI